MPKLKAWLNWLRSRFRKTTEERRKRSGAMTGGEIIDSLVEQASTQLAEFTRGWEIKSPEEKAGLVRMLLGTLHRHNTLTYNFNPFLNDCSNFCLKVLADPFVSPEAKLDAASTLKLIIRTPGSLELRKRIAADVSLSRQPIEVRRILGIK